ncbi:MAG: hypothetical protein I8H66_02490 [Sphingobacteriia bacterium]|nr:hypothetical protein [Sphingobacteriia bacterium]
MFKSLFRPARMERDLSFIGVDMHSHMLPGLDDGAVTIEASLGYFRLMQEWVNGMHCKVPYIQRGAQ